MKTSEKALRQMLLEIALGVDPTSNTSGNDDKDIKSDRQGVVPVSPSLESPVQLSVQKPNIIDPEYTPVNKYELASACSSIAELVPDELVEEFYTSMKEMFKKVVGDDIV